MNESLVQWTLLNNLDFLSYSLNYEISSKVGQEITTDFGRIDFIVENFERNKLVVELETIIGNKSKLNYCFNQVMNYKNIKFLDITKFCILYATETNNIFKRKIIDFGKENDVIIREYSLNEVKKLYSKTIEKLSLSFGLALPKPKNYTICYLRWLNKIMKPFKDYNKEELSADEISKYFTSYQTTNFNCYMRLALDFEMILTNGKDFTITQYGKEYIGNLNPILSSTLDIDIPSINLTNDQKRLLLGILTNGNWTVLKVNIYWFFRFIEVTNGEWLPKHKDFEQKKLDLVNGLFGVLYKKRTMYEILNFSCNFCIELGLVEKIRSTTKYDKLYLTPLGIEVNNIFSLDLSLKKSRLNLNFKYLE